MKHTHNTFKYVWTGIALIALFLVQTYAFTPARQKTERRKATSERVHFVSDRLYHDTYIDRYGDILVGNVRITHDGMVLTCDSAVVYQETNSFLAYGRVHMVQGDSLSLKGDSLYYDGTTEFANIYENVVMRHGTMTLYTDILNYDRLDGRGFYDVGGKIVDGKAVLTSQDGEYFTETKHAIFNHDVLLVNDGKDSLVTDTLFYNTIDKWAHATGPSNILSDGNRIYTEDGYYNTETGRARMYQRPQFFNKGRKLVGDSIHYDKETQRSHAWDNVIFLDPENESILLGDYGWYDEGTEEALCTRNAVAKYYQNPDDTLFIHGDTLRLFSYNLKTDSAFRELRGYYHVRAFRSDMQMVCDSLCYVSKDSCLSLYRDPIMWSDKRQILGEVVNIYTNDSTIDSVYVDQQALMIEQLVDTTLYNQVSGSVMRSYFTDGELRLCCVDGNGIAVNYPMEADSTFLYMNHIEAAKLRAYMENQKMRSMLAMPQPKGTTYPIGMAPPESSRLKGFAWFEDIRPKDKDDIFNWRAKSEATKLKAQPRRHAPLQTLQRFAQKAEAALSADSLMTDSIATDNLATDSLVNPSLSEAAGTDPITPTDAVDDITSDATAGQEGTKDVPGNVPADTPADAPAPAGVPAEALEITPTPQFRE